MNYLRRTWPIVSRCSILWNSLCIYDEIDTFVPRNDFYKKSWANYEAPVVQIWPGFSWIDGNLSFWQGVDGNHFTHNHLVICTSNVVSYFTKMVWSQFATYFWYVLHKNTHFSHSENEKWIFCVIKLKSLFGNIVLHSKIHSCAQYRHIWTNYVMVTA